MEENKFNFDKVINDENKNLFNNSYFFNNNYNTKNDNNDNCNKNYKELLNIYNNNNNNNNNNNLNINNNNLNEILNDELENKNTFINKEDIKIKNIIFSTDLKIKLNLKRLSKLIPNSEFNPKRLTSLIIKSKKPKCICLIFSSGKIIITGLKTKEKIKKFLFELNQQLKNIGYPINNNNINKINIENIIAEFNNNNNNKNISIQEIFMKNRENCIFEPDLFEGLIYKIKNEINNNNNIDCIIFNNSNKIIITGAKKINQIYESINLLNNKILK